MIHEVFGASFGFKKALVIAHQFFVILYMHANSHLVQNIYNS
jgi:hypothetical protein